MTSSAWGRAFGTSWDISWGEVQPEPGMQVVLLPSGRRFRKDELALYSLACFARQEAGRSYAPLFEYNFEDYQKRAYAS